MKPLDAFTDAQFGVWPEELPRDGALNGLATALKGVVEAWCRIRTRYREDLLDLESMPLARFKRAYRFAAKELETALHRVDRAYQAAQSEMKDLTRKHTPKASGIADTIIEGVELLKAGDRNARFPEGCFPPGLPFVRLCPTGPP